MSHAEEWVVSNKPQRRRLDSSSSMGSTASQQQQHYRNNNNNNNNRRRADSQNSAQSHQSGRGRGGRGGWQGRGRGRGPSRSHSYGGGGPPKRTHSSSSSKTASSSSHRPQLRRHVSSDGNHHHHNNNNHHHPPRKSNSFSSSTNRSKRGGVQRHDSSRSGNSSKQSRYSSRHTEVTLYLATGSGIGFEQTIPRVSPDIFWLKRMQFWKTPVPNVEFHPHERIEGSCTEEDVRAQMKEYLAYEPLPSNTSWQRPVANKELSDDKAKLRACQAVLNKLSWTTLEKMKVQFCEKLGLPAPSATAVRAVVTDDDEEPSSLHSEESGGGEEVSITKSLATQGLDLIVQKALLEPHFGPLYATFGADLVSLNKELRRILMGLCQTQFESLHKLSESNYNNKSAIGLMRFMGALYNQEKELLRQSIVVGCLQRLLKSSEEIHLESYAQLMTVVGSKLENARPAEWDAIWTETYSMAGRSKTVTRKAPNSRIKFLLQDLVDLQENNWVMKERLEQAKAKTIEEIHEQVRAEEKEKLWGGARAPPPTRKITRTVTPPPARNRNAATSNSPMISPLRKAGLPTASLQPPSLASCPSETLTESKIVEYAEPAECGRKMNTILKEYVRNGEELEHVLETLDEMVGAGDEGSVARGAAVVQTVVFTVLEMKELQVRRLLDLINTCLDQDKIEDDSLYAGLSEPLEFLRDIEIDAPKAANFLADLVAGWNLNLQQLLGRDGATLPERPGEFAVQCLARLPTDVRDADVRLVERLVQASAEDVPVANVTEWIHLCRA